MIELSCLLETCYETEISCTDVVSNEKIKTIMRQLHRLRAPPAPEIRCGTAPAGAAPAWPLAGSSGIFVMDVIALITIRPKGRMYIQYFCQKFFSTTFVGTPSSPVTSFSPLISGVSSNIGISLIACSLLFVTIHELKVQSDGCQIDRPADLRESPKATQ
jgi:hypothetical protein